MKHIEFWEAEDGQEFDTEEECLAYEEMKTTYPGVEFFNDEYERIEKEGMMPEDVWNKTYAFRVLDVEKAIETFEFINSWSGGYFPLKGIQKDEVYIFDEDGHEWLDLTVLYKKYENIMRKTT